MPHAAFARLRRDDPVAWVEEARPGGTGYWAVTRYADVHAASRAPDLFSSAERGAFLRDNEGGRNLMVNMDGPRHVLLRRYTARLFTPSAVRRLSESIRGHCRDLVRAAVAADDVDIVRDLAAPLPLRVLGDVLGVPDEDPDRFFTWSNNLVGFDDPDYGSGGRRVYENTFVEVFRYVLDAAEQRRASPRDDLLSQLIATEVDGRRMTDSELCALWLLLVVAGNETTRHLVSAGLAALLDNPDELGRLAADPDLTPAAVEELVRWVTPIMQFRRTATRDTSLGGRRIRRGDKVVLYFASANRDERVFDRPDALDVGRTPNPHLAFGIGPHFCLGAHLARLEAVTLFDELRPHLTRLRLAGPVDRLASTFMNGIKTMPATFRPRVAAR